MKRIGNWLKGISLAAALGAVTITALAAPPVTREKLAASLKKLSGAERAQLQASRVKKQENARTIAGGNVDTKGTMSVSVPALPNRPAHQIDYQMTRPVKKGPANGQIILHDRTTGVTSRYNTVDETGTVTINVRGANITIQPHADGTYVVNGQLYPTLDDASAAVALMEPVHTGLAPEDLAAARDLVDSIGMESKSSIISTVGGILGGVGTAVSWVCKTFGWCF